MNANQIKQIIEEAIETLFEKQPNIFDFTPETGATEWNLAHHLVCELSESFPRYDCDLEVTKHSHSNKRPDIIVHKRGNHKHNFLVLELKRDGNEEKLKADKKKIKTHWFKSPLHYNFGAIVNMKESKTCEVEVLENTNFEL